MPTTGLFRRFCLLLRQYWLNSGLAVGLMLAFALTGEWMQPGRYRVRCRVQFTTSFVNGALVLGLIGMAAGFVHGVGFEPGAGLPEDAPAFGAMCLSAFDGGATACAAWGCR